MVQAEGKNNQIYIDLQGISKSFGVTKAIDNSDLRIELGMITGLIGPNGAGKSTMMKIITGVYCQDSGTINFPVLEKVAAKYDTNTAREYGIYCAYQELSLCTNLRVYENFLLSTMPHTPFGEWQFRKKAKKEVKELLDAVFPNSDISPNAMTSSLSMTQRQMVEICKAIAHDNLKVLLLDEPTSYLPTERIKQLHNYLRILSKKEVAVIYISHKLDEIESVCQRVNVMKNGKNMEIADAEHVSKDQMISLMGGSGADELKHNGVREEKELLFELKNYSNKYLHDINLDIRKGEIIGISGLDGSGQATLLRAIYRLVFNKKMSPYKDLSISYVSGDRNKEGIFPFWSIGSNMAVASYDKLSKNGLIIPKRIRSFAKYFFDRFAIRANGVDDEITGLSGGNAQKVLIARGLAANADILLLNDPTRGVDIGTKQEIYRFMDEAKAEGKTILLFSTEDAEMLRCDRVCIMHEGTIVSELNGSDISEQNIVKTSFDWKSAGKKNNNPVAATSKKSKGIVSQILTNRALISIVTLVVTYGIICKMQPNAMSYIGITLLFASVSPLIFAALGQMFISIGGGIDMGNAMSIGLANVIVAVAMSKSVALGWAYVVGLVIMYGLMGLLILKTRIPAVIVTLGFSFIWEGIAVLISPTPGGVCPPALKTICTFSVFGIPTPIIVGIISALLAYWIVRRSKYGIVLNALGNNKTVMERAGWSATTATFVAYVLAGICVAISGIFMTSVQGSGDYGSTASFCMMSIAVFILGGCEFIGAISSPVGIIIGAFAMTSIPTLLTFLKMNTNLQQMVTGFVLIIAMLVKNLAFQNDTKAMD